jgi:hypothetical protein
MSVQNSSDGVRCALWLVDEGYSTYHIETRTHKVLLHQSKSVLASDTLEHVLGALLRVDAHTTLGTTEWNIGKRALEGHQGSQGHDLLEIDIGGITNTTLDRKTMHTVLRTVRNNVLDLSLVVLDWEFDTQNVLHKPTASSSRVCNTSREENKCQSQRGHDSSSSTTTTKNTKIPIGYEVI